MATLSMAQIFGGKRLMLKGFALVAVPEVRAYSAKI